MQASRRNLLVLSAAALLAPSLPALPQTLAAPNYTQITPLLATSGQPDAATLRTLGAQGYRAVIYLAPSDVSGAVPDEGELLKRQGIDYVHLPIPFDAPDDTHVQAVFAALDRLKDRKTLVHCEIAMRASTLVFLYRTIRLREDPSTAYEAVTRVWSPRGVWRRLIVDELAKNGIRFEPY